MKKWRKALIILGIAVLVGGGVFGAVRWVEYTEAKREEERERMETERIQMAYVDVYNAFLIGNGVAAPYHLDLFGVYKSNIGFNDYGVNPNVYLTLKMYESRAGVILSYETAVEYFSQEYEPDGSLRLYNNGLHPEIEAYVEWAKERYLELKDYLKKINGIYAHYYIDNKDKGFVNQSLLDLSRQMYDELARKEADPDYEMDLLSLQQQGY